MKKDSVIKGLGWVSIIITGATAAVKAYGTKKDEAELNNMKELVKEIPMLKEQIAKMASNENGEA